MDGGRAWLYARKNFKEKVKPWEPIVVPSKAMPPRCASTVPFHHNVGAPSQKLTESFQSAKDMQNSRLKASMMSTKKARSNLLALRQYTPVGMMSKLLEMEPVNAHLDLFEDNDGNPIASLLAGEGNTKCVAGSGWKQWSDQRSGLNVLAMELDENCASSHPSSSATLFETPQIRRRPASAGPGGRTLSSAGNRPTESRMRPASAHGGIRSADADRYETICKDPVSFQRLVTTLDKCPESTRLFRMLKRVELGGQPVRSKAVFRPMSAPAFNTKRRPSSTSPYAESPASQLQKLIMPRKEPLRRPASATSANRPRSVLGFPTSNSTSNRPTSDMRHSSYIPTSPSTNVRLTYIPPRPASAGPRMSSKGQHYIDSLMQPSGHRNWAIRPASTSMSGTRPVAPLVQTFAVDEGRKPPRASADLIRHLCAETGRCLAEAGEEWETGTMIWRRHPSAYHRIPKLLQDTGDLRTLADMLTDAHFIAQGLICSGLEVMLAAVSAAVCEMSPADTNTEAGTPHHGGPLRRWSRVKHFEIFLRLHAEILDQEPYRFFELAFERGRDGGIGATSNGSTHFVKYQVERSLQEAAETIEVVESKYVDEDGSPNTSVRRAIMLHEYLEMLLTHGCLECLSEQFSKKAHDLLKSLSKSINAHASSPPSSGTDLSDRVRSTLLELKARESPSLSDSLSLASSSSTRQLFLYLNLPPDAVSTSNAVEELKGVLRRDAAAALGVEAEFLAVDRVTNSSARIICSNDIPMNSKGALGMDPMYEGPIVCFDSRPSAWEFVLIYLSADPSTSPKLTKLLSGTVLMALRDMLRERSVELTIMDLDDGPSQSSSRLAHRERTMESSEVDTHSDSLLLVVLPAQQDASVSSLNNIVFVEPGQGAEEDADSEMLCLKVVQTLWQELATRYPIASDSRSSRHHSAEAYTQIWEMQEMVRSFVSWPSREEVLHRMRDFVTAKFSKPVFSNLTGAHGSGKSYLLAAFAHRVIVERPHIKTIHYRWTQAAQCDAFVSYLCWALTGVKELRPCAERLTAALLHAATEQQIFIIADGINDRDQKLLQSSVFHPCISALGGRVRVIYCARAPKQVDSTAKPAKLTRPAFRIHPLTDEESAEFLGKLCAELNVPLTRTMKTEVISRKQAGLPLYLRIAAHHLALFCELRTFQQETREKKHDLLLRACNQLSGSLEYLIEDQIFTLMECQYGPELVCRVLEYLYYDQGGISIEDLTKMLRFHVKPPAHVSIVTITSLCHDLISAISSQVKLTASGLVCMDLKSTRRAVARRYFDDYVLDDRETRAALARCYLAQKCSDEIDATLAEASIQELDSNLSGDEHSDEDCDSDAFESACSLDTDVLGVGPSSPLGFSDRQNLSGNVLGSPMSAASGASSTKVWRRGNGNTSHMRSTGKVDLRMQERQFVDCASEPVVQLRECHTGGVLCMVVTSNTKEFPYICTGGAENDVKVWDCLCPPKNEKEKVQQLRHGRDSNLQDVKELFCPGDHGMKLHLRNYCLEAHVRAKLTGHRGPVFSLAVGNGRLMSGSADQTIRIWNLSTFRCVGTLVGHRSVVSTLLFKSPNLYSAGHDGRIRIWDVDAKSCKVSIDSTKRAAIHSIATGSARLFVGLERRWDETKNPIKIWSMDLAEFIDELPSQRMQKLDRDSENSEKAIQNLEQRISQLSIQGLKTNSPLRSTDIHNALEDAKESKKRRESELEIARMNFLDLKGDIYPREDVFCMHFETCKIAALREIREVLFVGGDAKPILAWDLTNMLCIEAMDSEIHEADYTRCIAGSKGFLYSGGGKLTHQEKMAASSVAGKLKLEEKQAEMLKQSDSKVIPDEGKCGRVTVWCTSTLKAIGSLTFDSAVMSLSTYDDKLFIGEAGGSISIYAHHTSKPELQAQILAQVVQSESANGIIAEMFLARRAILESSKSLPSILSALTENAHDPALTTALLLELGKQLSQGATIENEEEIYTTLDCLFVVIGRFPKLARLQVHARNVMSHCINVTGLSHAIAHKNLPLLSEVMRAEMRDVEVLQRAGCLLYLEMLSPMDVALEPPVPVNDPTAYDDSGSEILIGRSPLTSSRSISPGSPLASTRMMTRTISANARDRSYKDLGLARLLQLEDLAEVIHSGALVALLASISAYAQPGGAVDSKGQADTSVVEIAVPLIRFMAVRQPEMCREIIERVGTEALDVLQDRLLDEKHKLEKAALLRESNPLHCIIADLNVAQAALGIKIRGRPVPRPVVRPLPVSDLLSGLFTPAESQGNKKKVVRRRASNEVWQAIIKASNQLPTLAQGD